MAGSRVRKIWKLGLVALAVAPLLAACGSANKTAAPPTGSSNGDGTQVTVGEKEYSLTMAEITFSPGLYTFTAQNNGAIIHALEIVGPGVDSKTPNISPGRSSSLTVTLEDGSYDFFCPIGEHKALGMNQKVTVTGPPAVGSTAATTSPTTSPTTS